MCWKPCRWRHLTPIINSIKKEKNWFRCFPFVLIFALVTQRFPVVSFLSFFFFVVVVVRFLIPCRYLKITCCCSYLNNTHLETTSQVPDFNKWEDRRDRGRQEFDSRLLMQFLCHAAVSCFFICETNPLQIRAPRAGIFERKAT